MSILNIALPSMMLTVAHVLFVLAQKPWFSRHFGDPGRRDPSLEIATHEVFEAPRQMSDST